MSVNERFARQTLIAGWEQERLQAATAVIVGMGALGNEVARILAMSGIGHLILCDHDTVALSNLSRCVLFREADRSIESRGSCPKFKGFWATASGANSS